VIRFQEGGGNLWQNYQRLASEEIGCPEILYNFWQILQMMDPTLLQSIEKFQI
jgi:hypothetical protein